MSKNKTEMGSSEKALHMQPQSFEKLNKVKDHHNRSGEIELKFNAIFENMLNAVAFFQSLDKEKDFIFIDVNKTFEKITGLKKENIVGKKLSEIFGETSYDMIAILKQSRSSPKASVTEKYSNIFEKYLNCSVSNPADNLFVLIFEDITDRRNTERNLLFEKYLLQNLLDQIPDTIYFKDLEGKFTRINSAQAEVLGLTNPDDAIGKSDFDFFEHAQSAYEDEQYIIKTGKPLVDKVERIRHADGQFRWVSTTKVPIYDSRKTITGIVGITRDFTERVEAQEALSNSEKRFRSLWENISDGMRLTNSAGIIVEVNDAYCKMVGLDKDELIGKSFNIVYGTNEDENTFAIHKYMTQFSTRAIPAFFETVLNLRFNKKVMVEVTNNFFEYDSGETYLLCIFHDITKRKHAEDSMFENEVRYRTLFENSSEGILVMGKSFEDCNPAICQILGCKQDDIIGHTLADFSPELQPDGKKSNEVMSKKIEAALSGTPQFFLWQYKRKDHQLVDAEVYLNSIILGGRHLIQASIRNITDRIQNEKTRNALYKISESVNTTNCIDTLYKEIHSIVKELMSADNFYIALYDEKTDLITFPYFVDSIDPTPQPKKLGRGLTEFVIRTGRGWLIDSKMDEELRKKGEVDLIGEPAEVWLGIPLNIENKTIGVLVLQDYKNKNAFSEREKQILEFVSAQIALAIDRKKGTEELKRIAEELKLLNANKDKLFSIISHDLRSPFHGLFGFTEILSNDIDTLSKNEIKNISQELYRTVRNQFKLLENLLDWSRLQIGRMEFQPIKINLYEKTNTIIELLIGNALRKNISILNEMRDDVNVWADDKMLSSILQNLISNAIKFTSSGGNINLISEVNHEMVEIRVVDSGIGIRDNDLINLFRIDVQHSTRGTANEKGTGLGLVLCKELIEKQKGKIWVESKFGSGSQFIFTLPKFIL